MTVINAFGTGFETWSKTKQTAWRQSLECRTLDPHKAGDIIRTTVRPTKEYELLSMTETPPVTPGVPHGTGPWAKLGGTRDIIKDFFVPQYSLRPANWVAPKKPLKPVKVDVPGFKPSGPGFKPSVPEFVVPCGHPDFVVTLFIKREQFLDPKFVSPLDNDELAELIAAAIKERLAPYVAEAHLI